MTKSQGEMCKKCDQDEIYTKPYRKVYGITYNGLWSMMVCNRGWQTIAPGPAARFCKYNYVGK